MSTTDLRTAATEESSSFDIKSFLVRCLQYWYFFLIAIVLSLLFSFYKARYSEASYGVSTTILVNDEYSSWGREYFLHGMELVSARGRLVNEVGILKSFPVIRRTLDRVPFEVFYYEIGRINTTELYKTSPYRVQVDSMGLETLKGRRFYIDIISEDLFVLSYGPEENRRSKEYAFGDDVHIGLGTMVVNKAPSFFNNQVFERQYFFVIQNLDVLARSYQGRLNIEPQEKQSSILIISLEGNRIEKEIDFLNALADVYIDFGRENNSRIAVNTSGFIDIQLGIISDSLDIAEAEKEKFQEKNMDIGFGDAALNVYRKLVQLEQEKAKFDLKERYYDYLEDYLKSDESGKGLIIPSTVGIGEGVLSNLVGRLVELTNKREQLAFEVKDTEDNIIVEPLLKQIASQKEFLLENLKNIRVKSKMDMELLDEHLAEAEAKVSTLSASEREYIDIERKFKLNNDLYTYLLGKKAEAGLAKAANLTNATVLDRATRLNVSFMGPFVSRIYVTNLIIAIIAPFFLVFAIYTMNNKIIERRDIEDATSIPILGMVGHNSKNTNLIVVNNLKSVISEAFRAIRTNIDYMAKGKEDFIIMITSSVSGEGKTFCAINLSSIFAATGKRTLLIGADLRKPKIYSDFGIRNDVGLSNYLIERCTKEEMIQFSGIENLDIVSAGPIPPNPAELLGNQRLDNLIKELKKDYPIIVIDTPPLGLVTDALLINRFSNVNLYIVRHLYTKKSQFEAINRYYENETVKNIGIIVNDIHEKGLVAHYGTSFSYGYGYGGYHYGYGYYEEDRITERKGWFRLFRKTKEHKS
ncbi:MAG: polysaccharide biosynthesis tyrosine autokinase [Flavobacteriales bacterium]|nr:polysaccharide biosynthesis tyrosine autokinase [Flavobacteriales bacterium]